MRQNQTISVTTSSGMFLSRDIRAENRKNLALYDVKHNLCDTGRSNSNDFKYIILLYSRTLCISHQGNRKQMGKEEERAELHRVIWKIANELRGSVDGWDFKAYVLGMLFYRFISEDLTRYLNEQELAAGEKDFDYTELSDEDAENGRASTVAEKGYFILPSELFQNVAKRCGADENLNETLSGIFDAIEDSAKGTPSEQDMDGLFSDFNVNSNKLGATVAQSNEKLCKVIN